MNAATMTVAKNAFLKNRVKCQKRPRKSTNKEYGSKVRTAMNSMQTGIVSGWRCRKNATLSSLKVHVGQTQNLMARVLYGKVVQKKMEMTSVIKHQNHGRTECGSVLDKSG